MLELRCRIHRSAAQKTLPSPDAAAACRTVSLGLARRVSAEFAETPGWLRHDLPGKSSLRQKSHIYRIMQIPYFSALLSPSALPLSLLIDCLPKSRRLSAAANELCRTRHFTSSINTQRIRLRAMTPTADWGTHLHTSPGTNLRLPAAYADRLHDGARISARLDASIPGLSDTHSTTLPNFRPRQSISLA